MEIGSRGGGEGREKILSLCQRSSSFEKLNGDG